MIENEYVDQAQEHAEHIAGCATEFQNCYTEAEQKARQLNAENLAKIKDAVARGYFAVVKDLLYFCKATDAVAGSYIYFVRAFERIFDAETYVNAVNYQNSDSPDQEDYSYRVWGARQFVPYVPPVSEDSSIPF